MKIKKISMASIMLIMIICLFVINIFLIAQNEKIKRQSISEFQNISFELEQHKNMLSEIQQNNNAIFEEIKAGQKQISDYQKTENQQIKETLVSISEKSDRQYSGTVRMKQTYDELLEEQKKKTVDISSKDNFAIQTKKTAEEYYQNKDYYKAYELYKKALVYFDDDIDMRTKKMKSLYYSNKTNTSNYTEILEDIKILKAKTILDNETIEIEQSILLEREGINE